MESVEFIGTVHTPLKQIGDCPLQESEGAPVGIVRIDEKYLNALSGLTRGAKVILLTWLHRSDRNTLTTKPRNNPNAKTMGVFATRSPDRPNPIGIHEAEILSISSNGEIILSNLEVLDGTPLIDIKPALS